ncbi:MAG TPA: TlpA disulfide reductase family protein [Flavobacterium sp.]|nr:TlpA disulfide reductase family protein [Flavobacterium sp.]
MKKMLFFFLFVGMATYAQTDVVKFTAKIANRNTDSIHIIGQNFKKDIAVNKKGVFTDSFTAPKGMYQMFDGVEYAQLFLKPGYDLSLTMDAKMFDETVVFTGNGSKENNFLAQGTLQEEKLENMMAGDDAKSLESSLAVMAKENDEKLADPAIDADFKTMMGKRAKQQSQGIMMAFNQAQAAKKMQGNASPTFEYENFKGGKTKLEDFKGKYVYIDTWATWCGPCRAEIPHLQRVEEKYKGKNIEFVSISIDTKKDYEKWKKMVADKSLGGTQVIADNDWNSKFVRDFNINSIPRFILIGPDGNVIDADAKRPSDAALQTQLDALVK